MEFVSVLSAAQIGEVEDLAREIWCEHYANLLSATQIEYMLGKFQSQDAIAAQIENEGYSYYLMREDEITVGYLGFCRKDGGEERCEAGGLFLSKLYVRKEHRGKGFARAAVHFLMRLCLEEGRNYLWLTVNRENAGSIRCYEKLGFRLWYEQKADIGKGFFMDDLILKKEI